ncbi:glycosyltransferase family 49 protein [Marasmius fiardii PR-910]|nr:glycosyltransferase family 49 protein [Marasmius fiardii PR-910]
MAGSTSWNVARVLYQLVVLYFFLSILFTTYHLLVTPMQACISILVKTFISPSVKRQVAPHLPSSTHKTISTERSNILYNLGLPSRGSEVFWNASQSNSSIRMSEEVFLSKAFANTMHPSRMVPFFYRANGLFNTEDITVTTQITSNRLHVFDRLVRHYQGPISVTIHVRNNTRHVHDFLDSLHSLYTSTPLMARNVDVHLVIDSFDRQFNTWRNIARFFARTGYVMMLDIDFFLCTDFRDAIRASKSIMNKLREGNSAFVIPAFEYTDHSEGVDYTSFPMDKKTLLSLVNEGRISAFHAGWEAGHNSTDYARFYSAPPGEVYRVSNYQAAYEPYIVFKKEGPPWCDERFIGYGGNKAACLFEMYLSGITYYVLSDHFIIHQNHAYAEKARKTERSFNKKVYKDFKEETCLRYLKMYHEAGYLNTPRGYNLQDECRKVKGIARIATEIIRQP